jgi:hypothetical protein
MKPKLKTMNGVWICYTPCCTIPMMADHPQTAYLRWKFINAKTQSDRSCCLFEPNRQGHDSRPSGGRQNSDNANRHAASARHGESTPVLSDSAKACLHGRVDDRAGQVGAKSDSIYRRWLLRAAVDSVQQTNAGSGD